VPFKANAETAATLVSCGTVSSILRMTELAPIVSRRLDTCRPAWRRARAFACHWSAAGALTRSMPLTPDRT
jgi:hypothetical protein